MFFYNPGYASALMESLQDRYSRSPKALQECSAALGSDAPAPLSRSGHIISKEEAVSLHLAQQSRFSKSHSIL